MSIIHNTKLILIGCCALLASACTNTTTIAATPTAVEEAFLSSSVVNVQPYTRTIFSSNNF